MEFRNTELDDNEGKSELQVVNHAINIPKVDIIGQLPVEICFKVLNYLDVKELITCSEVNKVWRYRINSDELWKRFCIERDWTDFAVNEKINSHCFIDPVIKDEPSLEIDQLCKWRICYNFNQKLTKNWTKENYIKYNLSYIDSPIFCLDCDGTTAATGHENGNIVVWYIKSIPYEVQLIQCVLPNFPVISIKTTTKVILAVQKKLLQIYRNSDGYNFLDAKSFELGDENIEVMSKLSQLGIGFENWYKECLRLNDTYLFRRLYYIPLNELLYANISESFFIYVWNLENGKKDSVIMTDKQEIKDMTAFDGKIYITTEKGDGALSVIEYDPLTRLLNKLLTSEDLRKIKVSKIFFLGIPNIGEFELDATRQIRLKVWLKKTLSPISSRKIHCYPVNAIVSESNLVIYSQYSDVTIWDPIKNLVLTKFTTGGNVGFIKIGYSHFLLVFINAAMYLWDWKHGHRLYRLYSSLEWTGDYRNLVWTSETMILAGGVKNQMEIIIFL